MSLWLGLILAAAGASHAAVQLPENTLPVPLIAQATDYSCGPATLLSVLLYWQVYDGSESSLYPILDTTPKDGTDPPHLVAGAEHFGLKAGLSSPMSLSDLKGALELGETVILDLQAWRGDQSKKLAWKDVWEEGHYVVLVGMDKDNAYVMDPSTRGSYAYLPLSELEERWHDYEDRAGSVRRYHRLGVIIRGDKHLRNLQAPLVRME